MFDDITRQFALVGVIALLAPAGAIGQTPAGSPASEQRPVFRATTELVQTDVTVLDGDGKFVEGLRRGDFELRIDGKVRPIQFFERVSAGAANEESQLAAARGSPAPGRGGVTPSASYRGRTIFFYVDDLHLDLAGLTATLDLILDFVEEEMSQDDQVAITSASGQVGFLQQLTDNKTVLRQAVRRIQQQPSRIRDLDRPPMTEYQALLIERFDRDVMAVFVQETMRNNPGIMAPQAEALVRGRSRALMQQAEQITLHTLSGLENLIRASGKVPGRKLVFFLSGGFLSGNSGGSGDMRRITSAAARMGTVIYAIDARGLVAGLLDPSATPTFDLSGRLARVSLGELSATQDSLGALARDTGGRAILNTNALGAGLSDALRETSEYYVVAWEPDADAPKPGMFRQIDIKLIGKPDLMVRVRRGFFGVEPEPAIATKSKNAQPARPAPASALQEAISSPYPERAFPISVNVNYLLTERGLTLTASMRIPSGFLSFSEKDGKQNAAVRVAGIIFNDRGQSGGQFDEVVTVSGGGVTRSNGPGGDVRYSHQVLLQPGLYRVQVAARDEGSGRIGSAHSWIEVPNLAGRDLALSSIIVGAPRAAAATAGDELPALANISVGSRFQRNSGIRLFVFAYNAARGASDSKPDLAIQVHLLQDSRTIYKTGLTRMTAATAESGGVPYAADLSLADLPSGRYALEVTVVDRVAGTSASQQARFEIE